MLSGLLVLLVGVVKAHGLYIAAGAAGYVVSANIASRLRAEAKKIEVVVRAAEQTISPQKKA